MNYFIHQFKYSKVHRVHNNLNQHVAKVETRVLLHFTCATWVILKRNFSFHKIIVTRVTGVHDNGQQTHTRTDQSPTGTFTMILFTRVLCTNGV